MSKKHRTRREKVIARLRRQVIQKSSSKTAEKPIDNNHSTVAHASPTATPKEKSPGLEEIYFYDPKLIKKGLAKTLFFSLSFVAIILILYWYLEMGGQHLLAPFLPQF